MSLRIGAEEKDGVTRLWKQPGVLEGLGDLPWHRDCGLGGHASLCPTAVVSVFLGPNTPEAGVLRFLPGSWQMSFPHQNADAPLAPRGVAPQARAGDVTNHFGDVLHVAPPPTGAAGPHRRCILLGYSRAQACATSFHISFTRKPAGSPAPRFARPPISATPRAASGRKSRWKPPKAPPLGSDVGVQAFP